MRRRGRALHPHFSGGRESRLILDARASVVLRTPAAAAWLDDLGGEGGSQSSPNSFATASLRPWWREQVDPQVCHGKPCIRGLRYPVDFVLELLSAGKSVEEILADYEDLEREDILAVLAYAARLSKGEADRARRS
jgi:uncharacterized protein (DUF433 family)